MATGRSRTVAAVGLVGIVGVVAAIALTSGGDEDEGAVTTADAAAAGSAETIPEPDIEPPPPELPAAPELPDRGLHPELIDIDGWLQSPVESLEELRGQVVAVQFWTFGCRNCKNTLDRMGEFYETYADQGLEIVGIHSPEFSYEAEVDNIVAASAELGVTWPIVLDTTKRTFHSWQEGRRGFWPRIYLLDRDGHIRYDNIGEGGYDEVEAVIRALLAEPA